MSFDADADADADAPRTGDVLLDRYRIGALIGAGGYGRVYRASDLAAGRAGTCVEVAVKVIHGIDDELRERFAQEAAIVRKLESPHTVRLLDHGISPLGMPFMVLELLDGTSVFDLLDRKQTISPHVALEITAQILDSLAEAHAMGVVHRDIKPENVFVTSRLGQPTKTKLLDFGIAKHGARTKQLTMQGQVVGTPSYMAPEQTSGKPVDARTDLYAVGLLLAEMVTGRTVMGVGGPITIMVAQAKQEPVPLGDDVRRSIVGPVVERAVRKAPAERYQSATEMLVDVRALLGDVNARNTRPTRSAAADVEPDTWRDPEPVAARHPTHPSEPAYDTIPLRTLGSGRAPPDAAPAPRVDRPVSAPLRAPPPAAPQRKAGSLGVPLAIVGLAALLAVGIVVLATGSRDGGRARRAVPSARGGDPDAGRVVQAGVKGARSTDPVAIRRALAADGYSVDGDSGSGETHTLTPVKMPCVGSVTVMALADEATARAAVGRLVADDTQGVAYLFEGRSILTIAMTRAGTAGGVDASCTASVVALLAR